MILLKPVLQSVWRASRARDGKGSAAKGFAKGAAKWAAKQGAKKGAMALGTAIASNPVGWAVAGGAAAAVAVTGGMIVLAFASGSISGGEGGESHAAHVNVPPRGRGSAVVAADAYQGETAFGTGSETPGPPWCAAASCAGVLKGSSPRSSRAVASWRAGITATRVEGISHCPVDKERVDRGLTDSAWGDARPWNGVPGGRYHSGTDVYKSSSFATADVLAMAPGTLLWTGSMNRHNMYLDTSLSVGGKPLRIAYFHVDNDIDDEGGLGEWRGGRGRNGKRSGDRVEAGEKIGTISTTEQGGMGSAKPHVHLGFLDRNEARDVAERGRGPGTWDPWLTVKYVCSL